MRSIEFCEQVYSKRWTAKELKQLSLVWEVLAIKFFQSFIPVESSVLDIGCGFSFFLNHIKAKEKVRIDANPSAKRYCSEEVTFIVSDDLSLRGFSDCRFDWVFVSNFLEHLDSWREVLTLLRRVKELLRPGGGYHSPAELPCFRPRLF